MVMGEKEVAVSTIIRKVGGIKAMAATRESTLEEEVVTSRTDTTPLPSILDCWKAKSRSLRPYESHEGAMKPTRKILGRQPSYSQGLRS
jgi:hypothetical protein